MSVSRLHVQRHRKKGQETGDDALMVKLLICERVQQEKGSPEELSC